MPPVYGSCLAWRRPSVVMAQILFLLVLAALLLPSYGRVAMERQQVEREVVPPVESIEIVDTTRVDTLSGG